MGMTDDDRSGGTPRMLLTDWIQNILERKDWTGTRLAHESALAPSTILRLLNDPTYAEVPTLRTLRKISEGSGYPIPKSLLDAVAEPGRPPARQAAHYDAGEFEVMRTTGGEGRVEMRPARKERPMRTGTGAPIDDLTQTLPVQHVRSRPALPGMSEDAGAVRMPRPRFLMGDDTAFAFYMPDQGLEPWHPAGITMYATKRREPREGRDVVVVTTADGRGLVRLLAGFDEAGMRLKNTAGAEETVAMGEVVDFAVVVGTQSI